MYRPPKTHIRVIQVPDVRGCAAALSLEREYDLAGHVVPMHWPDAGQRGLGPARLGWDYYWYATTEGIVGTVNVDSGAVQTLCGLRAR